MFQKQDDAFSGKTVCRCRKGDRGNEAASFGIRAEQMWLQQLNELNSSGCCSRGHPDARRPAVPGEEAPGSTSFFHSLPSNQSPGAAHLTHTPLFPGRKSGVARRKICTFFSSGDDRLCARSCQRAARASGLHLFPTLAPDPAPSRGPRTTIFNVLGKLVKLRPTFLFMLVHSSVSR